AARLEALTTVTHAVEPPVVEEVPTPGQAASEPAVAADVAAEPIAAEMQPVVAKEPIAAESSVAAEPAAEPAIAEPPAAEPIAAEAAVHEERGPERVMVGSEVAASV